MEICAKINENIRKTACLMEDVHYQIMYSKIQFPHLQLNEKIGYCRSLFLALLQQEPQYILEFIFSASFKSPDRQKAS